MFQRRVILEESNFQGVSVTVIAFSGHVFCFVVLVYQVETLKCLCFKLLMWLCLKGYFSGFCHVINVTLERKAICQADNKTWILDTGLSYDY